MILKLLSYNIRFGGSGREAQLAKVIGDVSPDLVVFQEATDTRVIERIAEATKFPFRAAQLGRQNRLVRKRWLRSRAKHRLWHWREKTQVIVWISGALAS